MSPARPCRPCCTLACSPAASASTEPGALASSARPTSPASSSTWARAIAASIGSGTRYGATSAASSAAGIVAGDLRERAAAVAEGGEHVGVVVGLGRRQRADQPERGEPRRRAPRDVAAPSAARPPPDQPSSTARSTADGVEEAGQVVAERRPGSPPGRRRCPRSPAGPRPAAAPRRRPPPSSAGRPSRESGVPWRYTTGSAGRVADVVVGEGAAVGQAQRSIAHEQHA